LLLIVFWEKTNGKLRFPKGMSALGMTVVIALLAAIAAWPGMGAAAQDSKPLQPSVKLDQPSPPAPFGGKTK
jgi:hypothetical protein